jgi:hypothetical protein
VIEATDVTGTRTPVPPPDPHAACLQHLLNAAIALHNAKALSEGLTPAIELAKLPFEIDDALYIVTQSCNRLRPLVEAQDRPSRELTRILRDAILAIGARST